MFSPSLDITAPHFAQNTNPESGFLSEVSAFLGGTLLYRLYLEGNGKYAIAQKLDGMGITPRNRSTWSSSTVSDILKNPVYTGKIRWSYRPDVKDMTDGIVTKRRGGHCIAMGI